MKERLDDISFIKTIMMIIIVLCHSCSFYTNQWFSILSPVYSAKYLGEIASFLGTFHVHTFVMTSGFIFYYLKFEKNKYNNYKNDIKKRAQRLLIPYFFTCILWIIPITELFYKYSFKTIFIKYILCTSPSQLWFLIMLFIVFILFEFISNKIKLSNNNLFIIFILSTLTYGITRYLNINYFQVSNVFKYIPFFYLGGYLYSFGNKFNIKKSIIILICLIILNITKYIVIPNNENIIYMILNIFNEQLLSIIEVIFIYIICKYFVNNKKIKLNNRIYKLLENNSFGIYLFHQQIIYFCILLLNGVVHPIIQASISFIVSLIIALCITLLLKKNKTTKFIFGL